VSFVEGWGERGEKEPGREGRKSEPGKAIEGSGEGLGVLRGGSGGAGGGGMVCMAARGEMDQ